MGGRKARISFWEKMKPAEKIKEEIAKAKDEVVVGGKYAHYKHPEKFYKVMGVGIIEATEEVCVMYEALYGELRGVVWLRTLRNFLERVAVDGVEIPRFRLVGEGVRR